MLKLYELYIRQRLWISISLILLGILLEISRLSGFWPVFPLYLLGLIGIAGHFFIGPLRLVQAPMEAGNIEEVKKIIATIKYPNLLYTPIRSAYFTIKGNMAMMEQDFVNAEKYLKQSGELGSPVPEAESSNKLQIGMLAMQKGDLKQAESYIRAAIRLGISDKENEAVAFLSMSQIFMNRRQLKAGKDFLRKAKDCKPKNKQVLEKIREMERYISKMPSH